MMNFESSTGTEETYRAYLLRSPDIARNFFASGTGREQVVLEDVPTAGWGEHLLGQLGAQYVGQEVLDANRMGYWYECRHLGGYVLAAESYPSGRTTFTAVRAEESSQAAA